MIILYLAQVMADDKLREVENAHLIELANRSRKNLAKQRLAKIACRFGLTQAC
jgi:hypothetical protein